MPILRLRQVEARSVPVRLESSIERSVVRYAESMGVLQRKLAKDGQAGWPDRMFLFSGGRVLFIEFKRPGGSTRAVQTQFHKRLRLRGFRVEIVDSVEEGRRLIDEYKVDPA